jgi:thiol:disulfide interchange protein DsbD
VKWSFETEKISDNEFKVKFIADIDEGWAIYSQFTEEGGPIPTSFDFVEVSQLELIDTVIEPDEKETKYDDMFEMDVIKLKGNVTFYQIVKTEGEGAYLKGYLTFMCCDDTKCLPPTDVEFEIAVE